MDIIGNFKEQAANLRQALAAMQIDVSAAQACELVASQLNAQTWSELRSGLKKVTMPTLGEGDNVHLYEAVEVDRGEGEGMQWFRIHEYEQELFDFLHDADAMVAFIRKYPGSFSSDNLDEIDILTFGNDRNEWTLKASELIGIRYESGGYWKRRDGSRIRFDRGGPYVPERTELPFFVPQLLTSTKGCTLLPITGLVSATVIVPPGRDASELPARLAAHLAEQAVGGNSERTLTDIARNFVLGFGCELYVS
ncbi:glyoxalase superfamily protein [Burkholderia cenocepacia]|uniref:glyoxalase superfamily protein n=1 Tax=Burkholderia cenocepacia TaxID=95486 RepID=UPI000761EA4F|nr:glyoxalase superfamily protein [Burkholderia cenocepacia]KWU17918.1 hypothetical protein AS149_14685 [Burkholderia cenocepacia]